MWIPFLRSHLLEEAEELGGRDEGDFKITRFPVRPMEKWVHDKFGELWMYDPNATSLWRTKLKPHYLYVDEYYEYGSEDPVGGYHKISKRWSELVLWGPYCLKDVQITQMELTETTIGNRTRGVIGKFVLGG